MQIDVVFQSQIAGVHFKYPNASDKIRSIHQNLAVKSPGPQQRRIQNLGTIGRPHDNDSDLGVKTVHFAEQLIERVFPFIISTHIWALGSAFSDGIQLVDENNARGFGLGFFEEIAHPGGPNADEHFDKIRAAQVEKRHAGLTGNGSRQQRLACSRRAYQHDTFGQFGTEARVFARLFQKGHDFLDFFNRLIDPGDILEGDFEGGVDFINFGLVFSHVQKPGPTTFTHFAHDPGPDEEENAEWKNPVGNQVGKKMRFDLSLVSDAMLLQILQQRWIGEGNYRELAFDFEATGIFRLG